MNWGLYPNLGIREPGSTGTDRRSGKSLFEDDDQVRRVGDMRFVAAVPNGRGNTNGKLSWWAESRSEHPVIAGQCPSIHCKQSSGTVSLQW
jgi:hypothetical protein